MILAFISKKIANSECASNFVPILGKVLRRPSQWFNKPSGTKAWVVRRCFNGKPGSRPVAHQLMMMNTQGEPQAENSWNCCTNSRACQSGSMSNHSRHCWGGNWLWDMPTGSEGRIGYAPCHSQICAQDPDSWPEATAVHQHLHLTELKNKMAVIPHPLYSPDLAAHAFFLFPKMKLKLKGRQFYTTEEIQAESQRVLDTLIEKDFQEAFQKWKRQWDRCLHAGGNYFEGNGGR